MRRITITVVTLLVVAWLGHSPTARATTASWSTYLGGNARTGFNGNETAINATTAPGLMLQWTANAGGSISTQPVVANGLVYWGAWDGLEHATRPGGTDAWATGLGTTSSSCTSTLGVASTATVATEQINGVSTSVVYVGGGDEHMYALNALTGAVIWSTPLSAAAGAFIWSSPAVYNGSVYVGLASASDCPLVRGELAQLSAVDGSIQHVFYTAPAGCTGATVWGSPAIEAIGDVYVATGNPAEAPYTPCSQPEPYAQAVLKLRASDLAYEDSWQVPTSESIYDGDFGSTPTLFTATINGSTRDLLGIANKNGTYYALDRRALSSGPVWQAAIAHGGTGPESGDGSISPSAWDGSRLYVGGGHTTIRGIACQGSVRALDPATGAFMWEYCAGDGPVVGAVTAAPGAVEFGEGNIIEMLTAGNGATLFSYTGPSGDSFWGAGSIGDGVLYQGDMNGALYAFAPPARVSVPIVRGWNLISLPVQTIAITSLNNLVNDLDQPANLGAGAIAAATIYAHGRFQVYVPGYSPDVPLSTPEGIFVLSIRAGTWTPTGTQYSATPAISLEPGWNLVAVDYPIDGITAGAFAEEAAACDVLEMATRP